MKRRSTIGVVVALALLSTAVAVMGQSSEAWMGPWKINPAKSTYNPGPPPAPCTSQISQWERTEGGFRNVTFSINAQCQPALLEWTGPFDGKDYPVKNSPVPAPGRSRAFRRIDANTYEYVDKLNGKVTGTTRVVISPDGKFRTNTTTGTNAQGQAFKNVTVWDKP